MRRLLRVFTSDRGVARQKEDRSGFHAWRHHLGRDEKTRMCYHGVRPSWPPFQAPYPTRVKGCKGNFPHISFISSCRLKYWIYFFRIPQEYIHINASCLINLYQTAIRQAVWCSYDWCSKIPQFVEMFIDFHDLGNFKNPGTSLGFWHLTWTPWVPIQNGEGPLGERHAGEGV